MSQNDNGPRTPESPRPAPITTPQSIPSSSMPHASSTPPTPSNQADDFFAGSDAVSAAAKRASSMFLRLQNDGDKTEIILAQRPLSYLAHVVTDPGTRRPKKLRCTEVCCERCRRGEKLRAIHLLDVIEVTDLARRIYEVTEATFSALRAAAKRYTVDKTVYEIVRHGKPGDTRTT